MYFSMFLTTQRVRFGVTLTIVPLFTSRSCNVYGVTLWIDQRSEGVRLLGKFDRLTRGFKIAEDTSRPTTVEGPFPVDLCSQWSIMSLFSFVPPISWLSIWSTNGDDWKDVRLGVRVPGLDSDRTKPIRTLRPKRCFFLPDPTFVKFFPEVIKWSTNYDLGWTKPFPCFKTGVAIKRVWEPL